MSLCKYKNAFGIPGLGIHSYRVYNIAIVDVIETMIGALLIKYLFFPKYSYFLILILLFTLGIVLHRMFCVRTTIDKFLFPTKEDSKKCPFN